MSNLPTTPKGWRECTWDEYTKAYYGNKHRGFFETGDGLKTKYFIPIEPIKASGVIKYNLYGRLEETVMSACGLSITQVRGKKFKVTLEEVME